MCRRNVIETMGKLKFSTKLQSTNGENESPDQGARIPGSLLFAHDIFTLVKSIFFFSFSQDRYVAVETSHEGWPDDKGCMKYLKTKKKVEIGVVTYECIMCNIKS